MANENVEASVEFEPVWVPEDEIVIPLLAVQEKPEVSAIPGAAEKKGLIFNIETTGLDPMKERIITIGYQDAMDPEAAPTIIMLEDEQAMLRALFAVIQEGEYTELIGYNLSFDYRFVMMRAMFYAVTGHEFFDCSLYDLMQAMQQGKLSFVYNPQKAPNLSDTAEFLFGYPKPFTDVEMMKYYAEGAYDKVLEFASSQISRTMALYWTYRAVTEIPFSPGASGSAGTASGLVSPTKNSTESMLTIPEAHTPEKAILKCPICLAEWEFEAGTKTAECPICGNQMEEKR